MPVLKPSYKNDKQRSRHASKAVWQQYRQDPFERQANDISQRIVHGEENMGRFIRPTEAASFHISTSIGRPLPHGVRNDLERGFGADLSAVRIHSDADANRAVRRQGARAFTAGRDIFFAAGEYEPFNERGRTLLAHETVHALQQTGRPSSHANISVQPLEGAGPLQCDLSVTENVFEQIATAHRRAGIATADQETNDFIRQIGLRLGNILIFDRQTPESLSLNQDILSDLFTGQSLEARSFLFDCLKWLRHYDGAAHLIDQDFNLQSAIHLPDFQTFLLNQTRSGFNISWITSILSQQTELRTVWPNDFAYSFRVFLFNPHSVNTVQELPTLPSILTRWSTALSNNTLSVNDRVLMAAQFLNVVDRARKIKLQDIDQQAERRWPAAGYVSAQRQLMRSAALRTWGQYMLSQSRGPIRAFVQEYASLIQLWAARADQFWSNVLIARGRTSEQFSSIDLQSISASQRQALLQPFPADNLPLAGFRTEIEQEARAFFQMQPGGSPPSVDQYTQLNEHFRNTIQGQQRAIGLELGLLFRNERAIETNIPLAHHYARAINWLDEIQRILRQYDSVRDRQEQSLTPPLDDQRMGNRIKTARILLGLAMQAGWADLEALCLSVLNNTAQGRSILILMSDWEQQDVPLEKLKEDFSQNRPVFPGLPFTTYHLYSFFKFIYERGLNNALEDLLNHEETNLDHTRTDVVTTALERAAAIPRPQRFQVADFAYALNENDRSSISSKLLIENHPRTRAFINNEHTTGRWDTEIYPEGNFREAFLWMIPSLDELIQILRRIPELNAIVQSAGVAADEPDNIIWLHALAANPFTLTNAIGLIARSLREPRVAETRRFDPLMRRVNTLRRRRLAPVLAGYLRLYTDDRIPNFSKPLDVITRIEQFARIVQPETDEETQVAALILELAPAIRSAFLHDTEFGLVIEDRYDIITSYYGYLTLASSYTGIVQWERLRSLLHTDEDFDRLTTANRQDILAVIAGFDEVRRRKQREYGMKSENSRTLSGISSGWEVQPGPDAAFYIDGIEYQLIEVYRPFTYYPAYAKNTGAELHSVLLDPDGAELDRNLPLFRIRIEGEETETEDEGITITGQNEDMLEDLTHVITMRSIMIGLENLGDTIRGAAELIADGAELIPGVGQGVALARITVAMAQFIAEELPAIREQLLNDPAAILEELKTAITGEITPEHLINFLLLPGGANPFARFRRPPGPRRPSRQPRGALGRLIGAVKGIGRRVFVSIARLRTAMANSLDNAKAKVANSPRLAYALHELPDILIAVSAAVERIQDTQREVFGGLLENPLELSESIDQLLTGLRELELPREVVPMDLVVEIILVFFLDRFGAKGRMMRRILQRMGALNRLSRPIADALRETPVDPNNLWREQVVPRMRDRFIEMRDGLTENIYSMINQGMEGIGNLTPPAPDSRPSIPSVDELTSEPFPEMQPLLSTSANPQSTHPASISIGNGMPMPYGLRTDFEQRFGHDFKHTRIHTQTDAKQLTQHFGADALTTGSHVFLSPGIAPNSSSGKKVLGHELAHVLQQTGARPLGSPHNNHPKIGQPGKGLHIDKRLEAAADRMANTASNRSHAGFSVEKAGEEGFQPSMNSAAAHVLRVLAEPHFAGGLATRVQIASTTGGNAPGHQQAEQIWGAVSRALRSTMPDRNYATFLRHADVKSAIVANLGGTHQQEITRMIGGLAALAQRRRRGRQTGTATAASPETELDVPRFTNLLETYFFEKTGVAVEIKMNRAGRTNFRFERVNVKWVDLGRVHPSTRLFQLAKQRTNAHHYVNIPALTDRDWTSIRQWLKNVGTEPFVWERTEYRLSHRFLRQYIDDRNRAQTEGVVLPTWDNYTDPNRRSGEPGLRVGTHGELRRLSSTATADRQSHHIPQFLMHEYFTNESETRPNLFGPGDNNRLPGFEPPNAEHPSSFRSASGNINMANLTGTPRAAGMPAILLATSTHGRGNLHLNREPSWDMLQEELPGTTTQRNTINNYFFAQLKNNLHLPGSPTLARIAAAARQNGEAGKTAVYRAIKETYRFMYDERMKPALRDALHEIELPYYASLAAKDHANAGTGELQRPYDPQHASGLLNRVIHAVETKNSEIMRDWRS
jgi:hypothetical protein